MLLYIQSVEKNRQFKIKTIIIKFVAIFELKTDQFTNCKKN